MKNFKLIAATALAAVMSFELSGCSLFGNKETQEESSQEQNESQMSEQSIEENSKESNQTNSNEKEEENVVNSKKDPVDILLDAKQKVLFAEKIDFTQKDSYVSGEKSIDIENNFRFMPKEIYFLSKNSQTTSEAVIKDNYIYRSAYDGEIKTKNKVDDDEIDEYYEEFKDFIEKNLNILSRENIKEIKEESRDEDKITFSVDLNDKEEIKKGFEEVNVDDVNVKVVINKNGVLSELRFDNIKMDGEEKAITISSCVIINAVGDGVASIEIPEDADSYKESDETSEQDPDGEDSVDEGENEE